MPQRNKTGTVSTTGSGPNPNTENALEEANGTLCDEQWTCKAFFLYEGDRGGKDFIDILQQIPAKQVNEDMKVINKNELLKIIKKDGAKKGTPTKSQKGKLDQENVELNDEQKVMQCVKNNSPIPGKPLASIIKKVLIKMKNEDIAERNKTGARRKKKTPENKMIQSDSEEKPPLCIIIFGFDEYDLPFELVKIGVPLQAVVKLSETPFVLGAQKSFDDNRRLSSQSFNMTWFQFWRKYEDFNNIPQNSFILFDLATISVKVPLELCNSTNVKEKKKMVCDTLETMQNYVAELLQKHKLYLENLTLIDVGADENSLINEEPVLYNTLIQMVPLECTSIPVILFSLIEQICLWNGDEIDIENSSDIIQKSRTQSQKATCQPAIIQYNDENALKTFHLEIPEIDFNQILNRLLPRLKLFSSWWTPEKPDLTQKYFFEFHLQRLWKMSEIEVQINVFYIYLHWFILCKIKACYLAKIKTKNMNKRGIINKDYIGFNTNGNGKFNMLDEWMNTTGMTELLKQHSSMHENVSDNTSKEDQSEQGIEHENPNNVNNSISETNIKSESMTQCLNEKRETKIMTKERHRNLKSLQRFLYCPEIMCLCETENMPKITNLTKYDRFKYIEDMSPVVLLQTLYEISQNFSQICQFNYYPTNKLLLWFYNDKGYIFESDTYGELKTPLGFRDYYEYIILPEENLATQKEISTESLLIDLNVDGFNYFNEKESVHYNLENIMMSFNERLRRFTSADGSFVTVKIDDWNRSKKFLNISVNKIDTEMNIYVDRLNSYFRQFSAEDSKPTIETMKILLRFPNEILLNVYVEENTNHYDLDKEFQFIYNDLTITLPSGLIIEVIKNSYDSNGIYIKQHYTAKGPNCNKIWDEKCRCFTQYGEIIIFKNDETVDIIYGSTVVTSVKTIEELVEDLVQPPESNISTDQDEKLEKNAKGKKGENKAKKGKKEIPKVESEEGEENSVKEEENKKIPFKVTSNTVKSWSGINYHYENGKFAEIIENGVNLRTLCEPFIQLYVDRDDGTKSFLDEKGHLISTHKDGTLLTTSFYLEPNEIEFSEEALDARIPEPREKTSEQSEITTDENFNEEYLVRDFSSNYVSYKLRCTAEHPNYAKVTFSPKENSIFLTLPGNILVMIEVKSNGTYTIKIKINTEAAFSFSEESIRFCSNISRASRKQNVTTITPLLATYDTYYFCTTVDSYNRTFFVSKDGDVKLQEPKNEGELKNLAVSDSNTRIGFHFENKPPLKMTERFFIVNDNFSGCEIINKNDIDSLNILDERKYKNVQTVNNPTRNRIESKTSQYIINKTHSDNYLLSQVREFKFSLPENFQRSDLNPTWTPEQSSWFFFRSFNKRLSYRQYSNTNMPRYNDSRICAVVVKTIQKVFDSKTHPLDMIFNSLEKYKNENEKVFNKYKQQGFSDVDVDTRLKENQQLICALKKEFPSWNELNDDCVICNNKFGLPMTLKQEDQTDASISRGNSLSAEQIVDKVDY